MSRGPTLKQQLDSLVVQMVERGIRLQEAHDQLERCFLAEVMRRHGGNQTRAAEALQVHRNTLRRKLERHDLLD